MNTAVVVIPTYNEKKNIEKMISYLFEKTFKKIKNYTMKLLIVDGNSPDNTSSAVKLKMKKYKNLFLMIEKKKEGIGAAYVKGFNYAVNKLKADILIEFDGDFQHPPETIEELLKEIDYGYDYVIGSRNIKGGSYPANWGLRRNLFSRFGGLVARFILFFPFKAFFKVTDPTTGLKATRVNNFFPKLNLDKMYSKGFGYKLELLYKMTVLGAKIKEIPLKFNLRNVGESKIESDTPKEMLKTILRIRLKDKRTRKFIKFGIIGFLGYIINSLFLEIFTNTAILDNISNLFYKYNHITFLKILNNKSAWAAGFATELAIINNYILNNIWAFKSHSIKNINIFFKFFQFNLTSFGAIVIQFFSMGLFTIVLGNTFLIRQIILILTIIILVIPYNWTIYNKIIWNKN